MDRVLPAWLRFVSLLSCLILASPSFAQWTAPTPIAPAGVTSDSTPTYRWSVVSGATWYQLWVSDTTGTVVNRWYTASQVNASSGECSVTPAEAVASGNATWWVRAWNQQSGNRPWSVGLAFLVGSPLTAPTTIDYN